MIGQTLSHFEITAKLGEGGMGEVYRATDTKLGREVAIKVLPKAVANDPDRLARFEREAKVLASLNHSSIASIFAFESDTVQGRPCHPIHADIAIPRQTRLLSTGISAGPVVVSPDGTTLAWVAVDEVGTSLLWIRRLDQPEARLLPGTEGAKRPFWSPDSKSLGFFSRQTLSKISVLGGSPLALASVADPRGGSWGVGGTILFVPNFVGPVVSIPKAGRSSVIPPRSPIRFSTTPVSVEPCSQHLRPVCWRSNQAARSKRSWISSGWIERE